MCSYFIIYDQYKTQKKIGGEGECVFFVGLNMSVSNESGNINKTIIFIS